MIKLGDQGKYSFKDNTLYYGVRHKIAKDLGNFYYSHVFRELEVNLSISLLGLRSTFANPLERFDD